jgi:mRNA interferase HicA
MEFYTSSNLRVHQYLHCRLLLASDDASGPVALIDSEPKQIPKRPRLPLDTVSKFAYHGDVTASELRRKLASAGCTFSEGKKHLVIHCKGARSLMPRHPAKEVKSGTVRGILKKLGIEEL